MIPRSTTRSHSSVRTMSSSPIIAAGDVAVLLEESNGDERLPTSANDVEKDNERCTEATKEPGGRERDGLPSRKGRSTARSEEHTSELQSLMRNSYAVFCLKKKTNIKTNTTIKLDQTINH